ncbi:meiosis regulator and mRNA stability factor 1 [Xenopus tropicalis]|uniref:Meiosis regulator and mRNA stability factor 1 n=1 Tax=Xenopus tropicalis TaxID=8364 RepID=MARF1_XENTR|nr:meiosis regulator and mRNA stability factor 1 [Xenopus tropicalis]B2GUN4.1 RecName: Full=Meiosis regulator and mRNA stability factor 1; AltName: Full=Limkain-b1; AltName: Full=Meiosis arrest female protein 1 homolog [Xenopus tropicalis]AAI66346.1 LOC733745 protein [Xenopus tropicalis]AAI68127.1 limkain b1 (lkap) [Xenopus tropicalis]|eukprot:NP_001119538.1 meiosis regulator and mRNA stability factor 1 [Xenopus tropicalis]
MEGNETANLCSKSVGWLQKQDKDVEPWLWKLSNCFSTLTQSLPSAGGNPKDYMEHPKPKVELKDVPPPPPPVKPCKNIFPTVPLPKIQPPALPAVQHQTGPKVSCCVLCSNSTSCAPEIRCSGGGYIHPNTILDTGTVTCQVAPGLSFAPESPFKKASSTSTFVPRSAGFSNLCLENRLSPCQCHSQPAPCYSKVHLNPFHGDHPRFQVPALGTSPSYFTSGLSQHVENHLAQSEYLSHYCTSSLHFNTPSSAFLKGPHFCNVCFEKPSSSKVTDSHKIWPNIPPPNTSSAPIPICNGCGTQETVKEAALILAKNLCKASQKYGSPDLATGQMQENLPPIGVFWDIENCSVPSGRSAVTVVKRIRERLFKGHREAEFICVCDISKENKEVIEELNNCQVTVAHINATAKNAADDKLRQSLRRFADTHTSPATVVLVSTDVNFALELSDLRHRHSFHIILIHKNQASEALLHHAHELIHFEEFISDLPPRLPIKMQQCQTLLYVYNLPTNRDAKSISNRLRRLSDNCGGKVMSISGTSAILRFANQESAERAQKRMENEDVFGNRITVSFTPRNKEVNETKNSCVSNEKAKSPKKVNKNTKLCLSIKDDSSSNTKAASKSACGSVSKNSNVKSLKELCQMQSKSNKTSQQEKDKKRNGDKQGTLSQSSPLCTNQMLQTARNVGTDNTASKSFQKRDDTTRKSNADSQKEQKNKEDVVFQISNPSAFSKLTESRQASPFCSSQSGWSSRSLSPSLSNCSSPIATNQTGAADNSVDPFANGADIQIGNLDYRMSRKELQQTLHDIFSRHGKIKNVELSPHTDYQLKATVQMENLQEAICAVNSLHRYKIGSKRIQVSLATGATNKSLSLLSFGTVSILQDAPACCLPLFKFTEIYEKKFGHKLIVSDLYRLTDTVTIRDQGNGRLVCLLPSVQARQSPMGSSQSHDGSSANCSPVVFEELEYHEPICRRHCSNRKFSGHDFDPDSYIIPFVIISLKTFAPQVHSLLQTHEGTVPLLSFPDCYAAEFSALKEVQEGQGGVPLEHLITCIPGVNIAFAQNGIKVVKWIHNKPPPPNSDPWLLRSKSPVGNPQLIQFSREVIDLLKNQPSCIMPVTKFIPTYHHHFAKQCRVSDYGYSKLLELLEAVPHVLQILGMGSKRLLTLTHRAQVKRFTQDLLKLLKSQASKQVIVREFSQAYHWCFSRDWNVTEYGVCDLVDIVSEIPDTTICVSQQDGESVISIPKRERTPEEVERTKQFSKEVVDLLRHQPHFRMPFNKFIPSYHHHFGRQCKLTYYGFTKLLDLFEAIPDVLQVLECGEEKILALTEMERIKALASQLVKLLRSQKDSSINMPDLLTEYSKTFGYSLRLHDYDVSSVPALMQKLCHVVKIMDTDLGKQIQLINRKSLRSLTAQLLILLMSWDESSSLTVEQLCQVYQSVHGIPLNPCEYGFVSLAELLKSLPYLVEVHTNDLCEDSVQLTSLYVFAKNVRSLLHTYHYQQIFLHEFPNAYSKYVGEVLQPKQYGYSSLEEILGAIPQVVWIKGHGHKRIVVLKNDMKVCHQMDKELLCLTSPMDLLCGPVPSCLPSPQLHPDPVVTQPADLIQFEEHFHFSDLVYPEETQYNPLCNGTQPCNFPTSADLDTFSEPSTQNICPQESKSTKELPESPVKRQHRNRVKLAANFSFAPVTKL